MGQRTTGRRARGVGSLIGLLMLGLGPAIIASVAYADAIPGAAYSGRAANGARVDFTVSSDGTLVDSYSVSDSKGSTCTFNAAGQKGFWEGAPISGRVFDYRLASAFFLHGTFTGPQSAAGTFQFHNAAIGSTPACDTGVVSWTATTTATPPSGGQGNGGNGNGTGGVHSSRPKFATRVALRKLSAKRLGGRISSSTRACRSGRALIIWRGGHRIGSTRTQAGGRYSFRRTPALRGRRVRVTALARSVPAGTCAAGSSKFIRA